jgi:hypothetical protein
VVAKTKSQDGIVVGVGSVMDLQRQARAHAQPFPGWNGENDMATRFTNTTGQINWSQRFGTRMSRRQFGYAAGVAVAVNLALADPRRSRAKNDATPNALKERLAGYSELKITSTDTELMLPAEITAGRYLVTIENQSSQGESAPVFVALAGGQTVEELMAEPEDPSTGLPGWFLSGTIIGAPITPLGKTAQAIIDFPPGNYAAMGEPYQSTVGLTVTNGAGDSPEDPDADETITMADDGWTGMPESVTTGAHLWKVTSGGSVPHRFEFYSYPDPITVEGLVTAFTLDEGETPPPGTPDISLAVSVGGLSPMSAGKTGWPVVDLAPGFYVGLCTMQNGEAAVPHYLSNELTVLEVVEELAGQPMA